jgi:hypothetical protein
MLYVPFVFEILEYSILNPRPKNYFTLAFTGTDRVTKKGKVLVPGLGIPCPPVV